MWSHRDQTPVCLTKCCISSDALLSGRLLNGIGVGHPEAHQQYRKPLDARVEYPDQLDEYDVPRDCDVVAALGPKVLKLSAERSAGVRKLFRLVQLEQVAERIVQEGLVPGAGDERDR